MLNFVLLIPIWGVYLASFWIFVRRHQLSMRLGLNIGIMHMVLVPLTLFAVQGTLPGEPAVMIPTVDWDQHGSAILRILSMVGMYGVVDFACHVLPQDPPPSPRTGPDLWGILPKILPIHLVIAFFFGSITLFVVTGVASGGHWADAKSEFLLSGGTPALLAYNLFAAVRLATLISLAAMYLHDRVTLKWLLLCLALVCAVDLYTSGNRIFTLQALVVLGALLLVRGQWIQLGLLSLAALPFGALMTMFPLIRVYMHRWSGGFAVSTATTALGEGYLEAKDFFGSGLGVPEFIIGVTEGININVLIVVVEDFHRTLGMLMGTGIVRGFVFWVPRSIWPGKPQNLSVLIGQYLLGGSERGVSMGATIFGEFWANFGFLGFAMIPVVLFLIDRVLKKVIQDPTMRAVAAFIYGYTIVRMPVSDFTVLFLFVIVLLNMTRLERKSNELPAQ